MFLFFRTHFEFHRVFSMCVLPMYMCHISSSSLPQTEVVREERLTSARLFWCCRTRAVPVPPPALHHSAGYSLCLGEDCALLTNFVIAPLTIVVRVLCVCVCVRTCMSVHVHVCMCEHTCMFAGLRVHWCVCVNVHVLYIIYAC